MTPLRMPGATLVTRLKVYDTAGPDGQRGGTPHFHLVCSELYFVLSGSGAVEIIDANGFITVELPTHAAFLFSPGTLHRLINPRGDLELAITMQNSGLPERGDTIATFDDATLADDARFQQAMRATSLEDAMRRRDEAVAGFESLRNAFARSLNEGRAALERVYKHARARTIPRHKEWYEIVARGAFSEAQEALQQIVALTAGKIDHLFGAQHCLIPAAECATVGFCGHLNRYFDPAALWPEGVANKAKDL